MMKLVFLLNRRPDISPQQFMDYYENKHSKIGEMLFGGKAVRYVRRYLKRAPGPLSGPESEPIHDAIMELWFPDEESCLAALAYAGTPEIAQLVAEDEEHLFDRASIRGYVVEECESTLPAAAVPASAG